MRNYSSLFIALSLVCVFESALLAQAAVSPNPTVPVTETEKVEKYASPMKTKGLDSEFTRHMFIDPELASKANKSDQFWLNDIMRFGVYVRPRFESRYNLGFNKDNKEYIDRVMQTSTVYFLIDPNPYVQAKVTFQDARVWGGDTPAQVGDIRAVFFANTPNTINAGQSGVALNSTSIREAFFVLKNKTGDYKAVIGRQVLAYGDQRMIGGANWTINGLSFDAAKLAVEKQNFKIHLFLARPFWTQSGVNGVVSANDPRQNPSATKGTDTTLIGTYNSLTILDSVLLEGYALSIARKWVPNSRNTTLNLQNPSADDPWAATRARQTDYLYTTGFRITNRTAGNNLPKGKAWDWTLEAAWQSGTTGRRINSLVAGQVPEASLQRFVTEREKYTGHFYVAQTGYTFFEKLRLGVLYTFASGDANRADASASTFQTLANPRFSSFPYFNQVAGLSENIDTKNLRSTIVSVTYKTDNWGNFHFAGIRNDKAVTQDAWYAINGAANSSATIGASNSSPVDSARGSTENFNNSPYKQPYGLGRTIYTEWNFAWMYLINDNVSLWLGYGFLHAGNAITQYRDSPLRYNNTTGQFELNNDYFAGRNRTAPDAHMAYMQFNAVF